jgi:hypothetical protein
MMGKPADKLEEALIREGWKTLVKKMGVAKATRFLVAFERGEGDSVKEIKRFWRGKSLDEIYRMVKRENSTLIPIRSPITLIQLQPFSRLFEDCSNRSSGSKPYGCSKFKVQSFKDRFRGRLARFDNSQNVKTTGNS